MLKLNAALQAWNSPAFGPTLKALLEALAPSSLPLHLGVTQGGMVDDKPITATYLNCRDAGDTIEARLGVFFTEIVINCGCGDEPMPINAYCELLIRIDKRNAGATLSVAND